MHGKQHCSGWIIIAVENMASKGSKRIISQKNMKTLGYKDWHNLQKTGCQYRMSTRESEA